MHHTNGGSKYLMLLFFDMTLDSVSIVALLLVYVLLEKHAWLLLLH